MSTQAIREISIRFGVVGETRLLSALNSVDGALEKLGASTGPVEENVSSVGQALEGMQRRLDPSHRAAMRVIEDMRRLEQAMNAGRITTGETERLIAGLTREYNLQMIAAEQRRVRQDTLIASYNAETAATAAQREELTLARRATLGMTDAVTGLQSAWGAVASLGVTAVLGGMATQIVDVSRRYEQMRASLTTVTGSADAAGMAFDALQQFATATPYGIEEATKAFITLRSRGLDPTISAMTSYGNTASAMGKSLDQMIEAVADAVTGENERLKEFGVTANVMGDKVAYTFRGVTTTVARNAGAIEGYLQSIGRTNFAGAMDAQSKTLAGAFAALGDSVDALAYRVGQGGLANSVNESARALSQLASESNGAADWIGTYLGNRVHIATGLFVGLVGQVGELKAALESLPSAGGALDDFFAGFMKWSIAGMITGAAGGLNDAVRGSLDSPAGTDTRFNNAFSQFGQAGDAAGDLKARLQDLALKGVPTLQDAISRATASPADTIMAASNGRLRTDQVSGLQKDMASQLAAAITEAAAAGLSPVVTEAFRTYADQAALHANRASNPYPVAKPGSSAHEAGVAVDISLKGMSGDQLRILKEIMDKYGFSQPVANDPVHWLFGGESGTEYLRKQEDALAKTRMGWQDYLTGIRSGTSDIAANTAAMGRSIAEIEAERVVREALARAQQDGRDLSAQEIAQLQALGAARGAAMSTQATAQFYQQTRQQTEQLTAAVQSQIATYGMSAEEVQRDTIARQLWVQAQQQGLSVTPQLTEFINEQAAAQAAAGAAYQDAAQQAQATQDVLGEFGNAAQSVLEALRQPADTLADSLGSIVQQLGDMTTMAVLFGQGPMAQMLGYAGQNGQQGGLFGQLLGNDLTGAMKDATRSGVKAGFSDAIGEQQAGLLNRAGQSGGGSGINRLMSGIGGVAAIGSGYVTGMQSGDPVTGAISGSISGLAGGAAIASALALTGPVGWIAAGIGALLGGGLGILGANSNSNHDEEQARLANYNSQYAARQQFIAEAGGDAYGTVQSTLDSAFSQMQSLVSTIQQMGDPTGALALQVTELQEAYGKLGGRLSNEFMAAFEPTLAALSGGQGLSGAFGTARTAMIEAGESLRDFVDDAQTLSDLYGLITGDDVQRARAAARDYALSLLDPVDALSTVQTRLEEIRGTAAGLQQVLVDLGMSAEAAAASISSATASALSSLKGDFLDELTRDTNSANDNGYLNDMADLRKQYAANLADAVSLGLSRYQVDVWFRAQAQAIVNDAGLAGAALTEFTGLFPELAGAVTASVDELQSAYDDAQSALESTIDTMQSFADAIADFRTGLTLSDNLSTAGPLEQLQAAQGDWQATLAAAMTGDQDALGNLTDVAQAYLDEARDYYAATDDYAAIFDAVTAGLDDAAAYSADQVSVAQQQLDTMQAQLIGLVDLNTSTLTVAEAVARVEAILSQMSTTAITEDVVQTVAAAAVEAAATTAAATVAASNPNSDAALALMASLGVADTGNAAMNMYLSVLAAQGRRTGGLIGGYEAGGLVGNGLWDIDSVVARYAGGGGIALAGGEFVTRAPAVNDNTLGMLSYINRTGSLPGAASGGASADMSGVVSAIRTGITALHRATVEDGRESRAALLTGLDGVAAQIVDLRRELRQQAADPRTRKRV